MYGCGTPPGILVTAPGGGIYVGVGESGSVETVETQVTRPTLNGSLELLERRQARAEGGGPRRQEVLTVERRDANGNFLPAVREVKQTQEQNGRTTENTTQYLAGAQAMGPVLQGFAKPVSDLSRGATVDDIVATGSLLLAMS